MNLFLIGYRGTGKSTVGGIVAGQIGWQFVDSDDEIERRASKSIARIFADDGEAAFRDRESAVVIDLAARDQHVIALGGGAVVRDANRTAIQGRGTIVWLTADCETAYRRITGDDATAARRPALTTSSGLDEIRELLESRTPIYRACADVEIATDAKTPGQVAEEIVHNLTLQQRKRL